MKKSRKKKNVIRLNLPLRMEFTDYNSFLQIQDALHAVLPDIKVKEIGSDGWLLVGVAYVGSLRDPLVKGMIKSIKSELVKCDF